MARFVALLVAVAAVVIPVIARAYDGGGGGW